MKIRPFLKNKVRKRGSTALWPRPREPVESNAKAERRTIWDGKRSRTIYTRQAFVWRDRYELYFSRMMLSHAISEIRLADFAGKAVEPKDQD